MDENVAWGGAGWGPGAGGQGRAGMAEDSACARGQSRPGDALRTWSGSRTTSCDPSSSVSSLPSDSALSKAPSSGRLGSRMLSRKEGWRPSRGWASGSSRGSPGGQRTPLGVGSVVHTADSQPRVAWEGGRKGWRAGRGQRRGARHLLPAGRPRRASPGTRPVSKAGRKAMYSVGTFLGYMNSEQRGGLYGGARWI